MRPRAAGHNGPAWSWSPHLIWCLLASRAPRAETELHRTIDGREGWTDGGRESKALEQIEYKSKGRSFSFHEGRTDRLMSLSDQETPLEMVAEARNDGLSIETAALHSYVC